MNTYLGIVTGENLGLSAIFACISFGFFFLRRADKKEPSIGLWSISFIFNGIGFFLWSNTLPLLLWQSYLIGEVFHILGFLTLVYGAYRFFGHTMNARLVGLLILGIAFWIGSISLLKKHLDLAVFLLRLFRSFIFISAAIMIFTQRLEKRLIGKNLAAFSMLSWGMYALITAIWRVTSSFVLQFGIMTGLHLLAAFGMVAMIVDKIRIRAEETEKLVHRLEGLLPICSYCKKIKDENNQWEVLELYIENHSKAEFSHGICPECLKKYHPEYNG